MRRETEGERLLYLPFRDRARVESPVSSSLPMSKGGTAFDETAVASLLGGERGVPKRALDTRMAEILIEGAKASVWTMDELTSLLSSKGNCKDDTELWLSYFTDSVSSAVPRAAGEKERVSDRVRLKQWITSIYGTAEDGTISTPAAVTEREKSDLVAQGLSKTIELRHFELALYTGRVGSNAGVKGGEYKGRPNMMDEGKLAVKHNFPTIDTAFKACKESGNLLALDRFFATLTADLSQQDDDCFGRMATRVLQWWSEAQRNLAMVGAMAVLFYVEEYRTFYVGRGIPKLYDGEIGQRALLSAMPMMGAPPKVPMGGLGGGGGSSGASSISPSDSASKSGNTDLSPVLDQMGEMLTAVKSMQGSLGSMNGRLIALERAGGGSPKKDGEFACYKCGSPEHKASDCPFTKEEAKAKKEEKAANKT